MAAHVPNPPDEVDEETKRILEERLRTLDEDAKAARPAKEVLDEIRRNLKSKPAPR